MYKWLIFICVVFGACKGSTGVPRNILGYDEMKQVIWDLAQVDEFTGTYLIRDSSKNIHNESLLLYQKVFALHKISNDEFAKSYTFYKTHPLQEKVLMDSLSQYTGRQRDATPRFIQSVLPKRLLNPAPMRMGTGEWHDFEITTQFANE